MTEAHLFGTDGIRGEAGQYPLDQVTIERIGIALARYLRRNHERPRVLIGRDTRESGVSVEMSLSRGLLSEGVAVTSGGLLTTPAVAHLTVAGAFDAGVVISASHNPYRDNGLKVFSRYGYKLSDGVESQIERLVFEQHDPHVEDHEVIPYPDGTDPLLRTRYLASLRAAVGPTLDLGGREVVLDCANGAASGFAPELFTRLGARVHTLAATPDGRNINADCGSLHPETLARTVVARSAFLGIAYDGDADRCVLVDELGTVCDGDDILAVAATYLKQTGNLVNDEVISTVMANLGLEQYIRGLGLEFVRTPVGDKQVLDEMLRREATLGGEQSGHILFLDHATTGDGLLTSIMIARILAESGRPLSALTAVWGRLPQVLRNVRVRERVALSTLPDVAAEMAAVERALDGRGRLLVRYSGTEPLVRIMLEGDSQKEIDALSAGLAELVQRAIGAPARS